MRGVIGDAFGYVPSRGLLVLLRQREVVGQAVVLSSQRMSAETTGIPMQADCDLLLIDAQIDGNLPHFPANLERV